MKKPYNVKVVGEFVADTIVEDTVILELKSDKQIIKIHETQLVNCLVATGKQVALLLISGNRKLM